MKKILTLLVFAASALGGYAQTSINMNLNDPRLHHPIIGDQMSEIRSSHSQPNVQGTEALIPIFLDYDSTEINTMGSVGDAFIWEINTNTVCNDTFVMRYFVESFDTLIDAGTLTPYYSGSTTITLDTIFTLFGHENNTGLPDTIVVTVLLNNANGYPTGTVLWTEMTISDTSLTAVSPDFSWLQSGVLISTPGITLNQGETFSVKIEYLGARADTFGVLSFYYKDAAGNCDAACGSIQPFMYPTSYYFLNYPQSTGLCDEFPDNQGNGLYTDCNTNSTYDFCEDYYLQNHAIFCVLQVDAVLFGSANGAATICPGESATLNAVALGGSGTYTYSWLPLAGLTNPFSAQTGASPATTTTYTVTIDDGITSVTATVTVDVKWVGIDAGTDQSIACGATADIQPSLTGTSSGATFIWSNGVNTFSLDDVGAGTYSVTVTNSFGCSATDEVIISLQGVNQTVDFNKPVPDVCYNIQQAWTNASLETTGWTWEWNMGDGSIYFSTDVNHTYTTTGPKTVVLTGTQVANPACVMTYTENVVVIVCLGVEENSALSELISIFPNPSNGTFTLSVEGLSGDAAVIEIYNVNGQIVMTETVKTTSLVQNFDLTDFSNGVYMVKITDGTEVGARRMVINK